MPLPGRRGRVGRDGPRGPRELEHVPIPETLVEAVSSPSPSGVQEHEGSPRGAFASVCLQNQGSGQSPATHVGGRGDAPEPSAGGEPSSRPEGEPKDLHRCHQAMSDHGGEGDVLGGPGVRSFTVATESARVPRTAERLVHQEDLIDLPPGGKVVDGEDPLLRHGAGISSPLLNVCLTSQREDPRSCSGGPARKGTGGARVPCRHLPRCPSPPSRPSETWRWTQYSRTHPPGRRTPTPIGQIEIGSFHREDRAPRPRKCGHRDLNPGCKLGKLAC